MGGLEVHGRGWSQTQSKAQEDAKKMQQAVLDECQKSGKPAPEYDLTELIGKGNFGRVYKATSVKDGSVVAVKIIDVDESDTVDPKRADTYAEFLKEVNALQVLREGGAQNINYVLEALPVGRAMWMVTEYCAGGSVATLMKPTAPGGLQEKWIIPILREVATAIFWVHKQGIIHRDIKCANVLVTEDGGVQLCDFGVAGMVESKFDKRSTFVGTPHWMAPELLDGNASYGSEVDIWAFGSMMYEIASGLPPNARTNVLLPQYLGYLRENAPRLEGDQYSHELKSLIAFCLEPSPQRRPTIQQVQEHPYIKGTDDRYPTSSLAALVRAYKLWEERGGSRKSLFNPMLGAQGPSELSSTSMATDEWNFSTTVAFDQRIHENPDGVTDFDAVRDVYGSQVEFPGDFEETQRPKPKGGRRRPPPQALNAMVAPLEKVFDPNTISNYTENSQAYYGRPMPPPASDLPLRDDSLHATLRESLIDLDASLGGGELSQFAAMDTIRPGGPGPRASMDNDWSFSSASEYNRAPLSDPADLNTARTGPNWQWPTSIPPASANPEITHFSFNTENERPPLIHQQTEPAGLPSQGYDLQVPRSTNDRMSVSSLIDLDEGLVEPSLPELTRPSTANSDVPSMSGSELGGGVNPFELERHASVYAPLPMTNREPSIYVSDASEFASLATTATNNINKLEPPDSHSSIHSRRTPSDGSQTYINDSDTDFSVTRKRPSTRNTSNGMASTAGGSSYGSSYGGSFGGEFGGGYGIPPVEPPSPYVMEGRATPADVTDEMRRLVTSLSEHLSVLGAQVAELEPRRSTRLSGGITETDLELMGDAPE
jgi:serine/threonine protein kinase